MVDVYIPPDGEIAGGNSAQTERAASRTVTWKPTLVPRPEGAVERAVASAVSHRLALLG